MAVARLNLNNPMVLNKAVLPMTACTQDDQDTHPHVLPLKPNKYVHTQRKAGQQFALSTSGLNCHLNAPTNKGLIEVHNLSQSKHKLVTSRCLQRRECRPYAQGANNWAIFSTANWLNMSPCRPKLNCSRLKAEGYKITHNSRSRLIDDSPFG